MRLIETSMRINAPPAAVWRILTAFRDYPEWNPFMMVEQGSARVGQRLRVRISPPGGKPMTFSPTVSQVVPDRKLAWQGRLLLPGLFDGEHRFELAGAPGGTLLTHAESFSGVLTGLFGTAMFERTEQGFKAMNEALKRRAEGQA